MKLSDEIYVRLTVYGEPTELDSAGCDGMYIEGVEICTKEIATLKRELLQWESLYGKYPGGPALLTKENDDG